MKLEKLISKTRTTSQVRENLLDGGWTHRITISYKDLNVSGNSATFDGTNYVSGDGSTGTDFDNNGKTITLGLKPSAVGGYTTLAHPDYLQSIALNVKTAFVGSSISALKLNVGLPTGGGSNQDKYIDNANLLMKGSFISTVDGDGTSLAGSDSVGGAGSHNLFAYVTTTGAATTALTAGEFELYFRVLAAPTGSDYSSIVFDTDW